MVAEAVLTAGFQVRLQIVQTRDAVRVFDNDFPIEQGRFDNQFFQRHGDAAKAYSPVKILGVGSRRSCPSMRVPASDNRRI
jgi:hypothetical protein